MEESRIPSMTLECDRPPDGGIWAWLQVFAGHLVIFNSWGCVGSFGVFQEFYTLSLGHSSSDISWIGSIQIFLLFFMGALSGSATDTGFFRQVLATGILLQVLGMFTTSFSGRYWHLLLAQGVCLGLGNGLQFCPTITIVSTYFGNHKATAIGIVASGSATGGIAYTLLARKLLPSIGLGWTMRVMGFISISTGVVSLALLRSRLPPRPSGDLIYLAAFKELSFTLYCAAMFLEFWGLYFVFFYISQFGRETLQINLADSTIYLAIINGVAFPFRIASNCLADRYFGALNCIISAAFISGFLVLLWSQVHSKSGLITFSIFYGISAGGIQSLFPATLTAVTADLQNAGNRLGMIFTIVSIAVLTGPSLGGRIISINGGSFVGAQIWGGFVMIVGALTLVGARWAKVGWKLRVKV